MRRLAIAAGVPDAEPYTAHWLRAGGATVAHTDGIPVSIIARQGRWAPASPVLWLVARRLVDPVAKSMSRGRSRSTKKTTNDHLGWPFRATRGVRT
ncbi:hypothetical protein [Actinomadura verrucosospora]|uniref:Uncharacterized protein n=1 Tax=Actinomadura verrucosospora TaxID=46165 RepID=A0A7D3W149_ACTVE|nr:hypothetical protein [Actinomadura verrucosospora]QKG23651.1 hypothetical protein ACTIVE_5294 [Actinomadura verrucosospora]